MPDRLLSSLLQLDPDLGALLADADRLEAARAELQVAVHALDPGPWEAARLASASAGHIGVLVLDGVVAREVLVADTVSTELLGHGDVVRPWQLVDEPSLLPHEVRWNVLARSRIALLDRRLGTQLGRFPEITSAIFDRVDARTQRLALTQAISQLNRVDRRVIALFWHLAERWGRMTPDGVAIPLTLSHRMLGQLVGARRPTISTAVGELLRSGELARRADGTWLADGRAGGGADGRRRARRPDAPPPAPGPLRPTRAAGHARPAARPYRGPDQRPARDLRPVDRPRQAVSA